MSESSEEGLKLRLVVYDLLPPSRLASVLNFVGTGVYHSSVELTIPLGPNDTDPKAREYAYGGHDDARITGIFAIPSGTAAQRMPGIRFYMHVDLGDCFGPEWEKAFGPKNRRPSRPRPVSTASSSSLGVNSIEKSSGVATPYGAASVNSASTSVLTLNSEAEDSLDDDFWEDDGGVSDGTSYMNKVQRRAFRIIETMKKDRAWAGARYNLLGKNCNTFTDELCWRLTGKRAPTWINRAAWVATTVPCIVPPGWIDETDEIVADSGADEDNNSASITIAPPRADKMNLGGSSEV